VKNDDENANYVDLVYGKPNPKPKRVKEGRSPAAIAKAESRIGRKQIGAWLDSDYHKGMRLIAARRELSMQDALEEAIADFLVKYGQPLPPGK